MEDIEIFKNNLSKKAKKLGFSDWEIYFVKTNNLNIKVFKKEISQYKNSKVCGLSFRGIYNNKIGYFYTEKIKDDVIDNLLLLAKENSNFLKNTQETIFKYDGKYKFYKEIKKEDNSDKTTIEEKINICKNLEDTIYRESKYVSSVNCCSINNNFIETYLFNTNGINLKDKSFFSYIFLSIVVEKDGDKKVASEVFIDKNFKNLNIEEISKKIVNKGISKIGSKSIKPCKSDVIFKNDVVVDILNIFISNFYGESVKNGFSLLKNKIGKKVASSLINIYDNVEHNKSLKSIAFDCEGVPTQDKVIIEKGILKNYMYNLKTALKDNKMSTGNSFRNSFKSPITTSHLNFYIKESNIIFDNILKNLQEGLLITKISGLHTGANVVSGDFSFLAEGFFIKKGEIKYPVNQITISNNFYNMLKNIYNIANDLYFDIPNIGGSIGAPSILVRDINISGI